MKKGFFVLIPIILSIMGCATGGSTSANVTSITAVDELDPAIREASDYLNTKIPQGRKTVFLNITSDYPDLSEYILSLLSENAVNDGVFSVVDRVQLDAIRTEMNFQLSGEVDDNSAQEIGKMLGAQTIVSGAVNKIGSLYRMQVKAIEVQTAGVQGQWSKTVPGGGVIITALTENQRPAARSGSGSTTVVIGRSTSDSGRTETSVPVPAPVQPVVPTYRIGDTGPAGGIVFYDKGNDNDGWRYMEVSPSSLGTAQWGTYGTSVMTDTTIGMGKRNTLILVDTLRGMGETGRAAQLCVEYGGGGVNDWFLPSRDELNAIYTSLVKSYLVIDQGLTGWTGVYWSSSQSRVGNGQYVFAALGQSFSDGQQFDYPYSGKREDRSVRAVRQFK
jgi:hypothetical protein